MMRIEVIVRPRAGARDPQAEAMSQALHDSGFAGCRAQSVGRCVVLCIEPERASRDHAERNDADAALARARDLCDALLVNPHLETYELRVMDDGAIATEAA